MCKYQGLAKNPDQAIVMPDYPAREANPAQFAQLFRIVTIKCISSGYLKVRYCMFSQYESALKVH